MALLLLSAKRLTSGASGPIAPRFDAPVVKATIRPLFLYLDQRHANPYTSVAVATSPSIILNASEDSFGGVQKKDPRLAGV